MAAAPARSHPSSPHPPPAGDLLAPGPGLVDRIRDLMSGRRTTDLILPAPDRHGPRGESRAHHGSTVAGPDEPGRQQPMTTARTSRSKARARRHGRTRTTRGRAGDRGGFPAIALPWHRRTGTLWGQELHGSLPLIRPSGGGWVRTLRRRVGLLVVPVLGLGLVGCGGSGERGSDASAAAAGFERAISTRDTAAVCAALAPESLSEVEESGKAECADAIPESRLPVGGSVRAVDVYGRQARVVLASDTLFFSQFADSWKVVAAGCRLRAGHPYQCAVKGG